MTTKTLAPLDTMQRYSIEEATQYLRISRASLYLKIRSGSLRPIKDGSRTLIPGSEIARLSVLPAHSAA
jgi:excisionase family DNA binding protein